MGVCGGGGGKGGVGGLAAINFDNYKNDSEKGVLLVAIRRLCLQLGAGKLVFFTTPPRQTTNQGRHNSFLINLTSFVPICFPSMKVNVGVNSV